MKMSSEEIIRLLNIIIGRTQASGTEWIDKDVLDNLYTLTDVTYTLLTWIKLSAVSYGSPAASEHEIGELARDFLIDIKDDIRRWLNED